MLRCSVEANASALTFSVTPPVLVIEIGPAVTWEVEVLLQPIDAVPTNATQNREPIPSQTELHRPEGVHLGANLRPIMFGMNGSYLFISCTESS